jgi:acyl-coenzyme A synthetase/AMP-(fatty) acid ligase
MSLVKSKKNPITGALLVADVVLRTPAEPVDHAEKILKRDILQFCREQLAVHKVPAAINIVPALGVAESGKLVRANA